MDGVILNELENYVLELRAKLKKIQSDDFKFLEAYVVEILEFIRRIKNLEKYQIDNFITTVESLEYSIEKSVNEQNLNHVKFEVSVLLQYLSCVIYKIENNISINGEIDLEKIKRFWEEKTPAYGLNHFIAESEEKGEYKYELSILVLAYNKLEYTKQCVESIFRYLPTNVNYELILFNHGSSDGTLEYFNSIPNVKVVDIHKNGAGFDIVYSFIEGEYAALVSNDVLLTKNAFDNMLKCLKSDKNIALVVPQTTHISNHQQIQDSFENLDEMYEFAAEFNKSNSLKWEQKAALVTPICLLRTSNFVGKNGTFFNIKNIGFKFAFTDDMISYFFRKVGGKLILARDTFCYHYGSITINDDISNTMQAEKMSSGEEFYLKERAKYFKLLNYDPWKNGAKASLELEAYLNHNKLGDTKILGIGSGLGANLYRTQYIIKDYVGNTNTFIYCINDIEAINDVVANSYDGYLNVDDVFDISIIEEYEKNQVEFDYILIEDVFPRKLDYKRYFDALFNILKVDGELAIANTTPSLDVKLLALFPWAEVKENWIILRHKNVQSQKLFIPVKMNTYENKQANKIMNVLDALLTQQFEIKIETDDSDYWQIAHGYKFVLANDPVFYRVIEANKEFHNHFRQKENILIVDESNYKTALDIPKKVVNYFSIKYIATSKEVENILLQNGLKVIYPMEYSDNIEQNIYNAFISYFISLEE